MHPSDQIYGIALGGRVVELEKGCGLNLDSPLSTPESALQDLKTILS